VAPIAVHMLTAYKNAERGIFQTLRGILEGIMKYRQRKKTNDITENMVSIESAGNPWIGPRWDLMAIAHLLSQSNQNCLRGSY